MYARKDKSPRLVTPGFEHLNNFVLFGDGKDVFIKRIDNDESLTTNLVQYTKAPLSADCTYFTMSIEEITEGEFVMFGITNRCVAMNPLWTIDRSVRYHSNDGGVFNGGMGIKTYHPYTIGDRVTCKLDYTGPDRCLVNFLKNDRLVYRQWVNLPPGQLYPTIGVSRTEAKLKVDWPEAGKGDIDIRTDLPSNWFGWTGLHRDDQTKVVTLAELDKEMVREAYNIQSPNVFCGNFTYFEIQVVNKTSSDNSEKTGQAIGLVAGNCEPFVMPGWTQKSIGYHSEDGGLYSDGVDIKENVDSSKRCAAGDRMGCGIVFPSIPETNFREPILVLVYFTKNGKLVHTKRMRQPRGGFFPCVSFTEGGDSVKLDVKCPPPMELLEDLNTALNSADVSADFRCSEVIQFKELAPDSAVFTLATEEDSPQLVQYLRYPLSDVGDGFSMEVLDIRANTELQLGVSTRDHAMEGQFLGSNSTSCGYLLRLGSLAMKEGMRPVSKWAGKGDIISCYLDFKDDTMAVICFENSAGDMIGRATVSRVDVSSSLMASIVMSAGPCTVRMNWSRSIYNTHNFERAWGEAGAWLRPPGVKATKNVLTLQTAGSYSFAASAQCRQPMLTGTSFFGIKLLSSGDAMPGIGLSKATTDVHNVLGAESGEVSFLPSKGELILNKSKWRVKDAPVFKRGDTLQCGLVFAEADRVQQKGVVYFCRNGHEFFHCRFLMAHGGAYASITFSSADSSAEILQNSRAQPLPEKLTSEWLNEDHMSRVEPCSLTDGNTYGDKESTSYDIAEPKIMSNEPEERIIYVSHTIRERDRLDPIVNQLRRHYLNMKFETSANCVSITDKETAIQKSELIIVCMSQLYSESHEMVMEYSLFAELDKPIIVAADKNMDWPPRHYFDQDRMIQSFPRTLVSTVDNKADMHQLVLMVDSILPHKIPKHRVKKQRNDDSSGSLNKKSSTCNIL